jgi:hypothetical protein
MSRKLHYREYEVLKSKRKHCGVALPADRVLLKLRSPGQRPFWTVVDWEAFKRGRYFRATRNKANYDARR